MCLFAGRNVVELVPLRAWPSDATERKKCKARERVERISEESMKCGKVGDGKGRKGRRWKTKRARK